MSVLPHFHITYDEPNEHWPNGAWSVYQIDGDEIAQRTVFERVNSKGWYEGKVIARHSWCGYIGMFHTMADATAAIEKQAEADRKGRTKVTKTKMVLA